MRNALIRLLVGCPAPWPTGQERIRTLRAALLWRLAFLPGLDAVVEDDGRVRIVAASRVSYPPRSPDHDR